MVEIILDASQIEIFEACPRKWYYSYVLNLVPNSPYHPYDIGSYYHEVLAFYYNLLSKSSQNEDKVRKTIDYATQLELFHKYHIIEKEDQVFHIKRLITYLTRYEIEDLSMEIIAIEGGFSYLLYEDTNRRYILEGKIDILAKDRTLGIFVIDHKTQSRKNDIYELNHQVFNYLTFTKADYFMYNYIGLQESLPKDGLRRVIYKPHTGMLEQWLKEVRRTFDLMYDYLLNSTNLHIDQAEGFPRRRSACASSKYGLCQFHKLCAVPDNSPFTQIVRSAYKEKDEIWRPWS